MIFCVCLLGSLEVTENSVNCHGKVTEKLQKSHKKSQKYYGSLIIRFLWESCLHLCYMLLLTCLCLQNEGVGAGAAGRSVFGQRRSHGYSGLVHKLQRGRNTHATI